MKPFNLDKYFNNPSKKVVTRDGRKVKVLGTNYYCGIWSITAEVEGNDYSSYFTQDGKYSTDGDSPLDIFFAPEKKHKGWVNIYRDFHQTTAHSGNVYDTKTEAENNINKKYDYIATVKIEWEE